jgi:hypothetical protein
MFTMSIRSSRLVTVAAADGRNPWETRMTYDRKTLGRLAVVFGISTFGYGIAGIAATHARDHLMARLQLRHDMQGLRDGSGVGVDGVRIRVAARKMQIEDMTGSEGTTASIDHSR